MAAIGKIRSWGPALIGVVGVALFAFIAGDLWQSCEATSNEKRMQVGEVLGEKISVQDYQALVDEYQQVMKMTQGRDNFTEAELNQIQDQVWNTFVNNTILAKEAEALGLTVTTEELQNILKEGTNPMLMQTPFVNQQTGRFDVSLLTKFLADYKTAGQNPQVAEQYLTIYKYWTFIEKSLKQQTLAMKYQSLLMNSLVSNPVSAKMAFEGQNDESNVQLASVAYSTIKDDEVEVSDADLKAKYDEQKEMYKQVMESRDIKYVDFQVLPSVADRDALMATMKEAAQKLQEGAEPAEVVRKAQSTHLYSGIAVTRQALPTDIAGKVDTMAVGETSAPFETKFDNTLNVVKLIAKNQMPDSVEYRQIQVGGATVEEAVQRTDSIYNALQAGADFEEMAKKYGQDGSKNWMTSAMYENAPTLDAETKTFIESLNTTEVNGLKKLNFSQGNIIFQITDRKAMVDKYLVAIVKHTIDFSKETYSAAYNKFSQYVSENQTLEALEKNAEKYGFTVRERNDVYNSEHNVAGIRSTREALKWIFDAKEGDVSPLYECGVNDHLLVVAMTKVHNVGYRTLDDVKDAVKAQVVADKKFAKISEKLAGAKSIDDAKAKGAQVNDVNQITFSAPVFVAQTGSSEPALSGAVAATKEGAFSSSLVKGNGGAYLFQVVKKSQREGAKFDAKATEMQLQQQALSAASRFMNELYLNAGVVDNRYLFF